MLNIIEVASLVKPILKNALEPYGFQDVELSFSSDHDGDDIIVAVVKYRQDAPKLKGDVLLDALNEALNKLAESGDHRFLHIRHVYADGDEALDNFRPARPRKKVAQR